MSYQDSLSSETIDYIFPHWFCIQRFVESLEYMEIITNKIKISYRGTETFNYISTIVETLCSSEWCINYQILDDLQIIINEIYDTIIPNLRNQKYCLRSGVQVYSNEMGTKQKEHSSKKYMKSAHERRYRILSFFEKRYINSENLMLLAESQLSKSRKAFIGWRYELTWREMLILDLNSLARAMSNAYNKGTDASVNNDNQV
ncbi:hypothetical protein K501DRAFT_266277 [Backusella circina FSU 941]|nr:hypothetical protein K501DRAFT_266277 [Backusella circina FSU 941]